MGSSSRRRSSARDGDAKATYWIGVDDQAGSVVAGALRLATDTSEYFRCARALTPPNVFEIRMMQSGKFRADLEVEPPHEVSFFNDAPVAEADSNINVPLPKCPTRMTLSWEHGFHLEEPERQPACLAPSKPRFVEIRDDGEIVAAPKLTRQAR
jgi:hypothetical protein